MKLITFEVTFGMAADESSDDARDRLTIVCGRLDPPVEVGAQPVRVVDTDKPEPTVPILVVYRPDIAD